MQKGSLVDFELLKTGIETESFITTINQNEDTQTAFINRLETNRFTLQQLLDLIVLTKDSQVKSLLILHLLSQNDFLKRLQGESILSGLANNGLHKPSRLNALVQLLDVRTLTLAMLDKLEPEAAVSILCSVLHFHLLNEAQIEALLKKSPVPVVINYWLRHFACMPNAHFILAHLLNLDESDVINELKKIESSKKEAIITIMVKHLELFKPSRKILQGHDETHLILAIRLFINGHKHPANVAYIILLTDKLLSKNHTFSLEAIQLLIALNGENEFSELNTKTAFLTKEYIKTSAQAGEIEVFYDSGRINYQVIKQPIRLNTKTLHPNILENPFVEKLSNQGKSVNSLDYFLLYSQDNSENISTLIRDYLSYFAQEGTSENRHRSIYHISKLMNSNAIGDPVREAIFSSFLLYPELYDDIISLDSLQFDASRLITYFGKKGEKENYIHVRDLMCKRTK